MTARLAPAVSGPARTVARAVFAAGYEVANLADIVAKGSFTGTPF